MICFTESELQQHEELIITRALAAKDLALAQANRHKDELFQKLAEKDREIADLQDKYEGAKLQKDSTMKAYQQLMEKAVGLAETVLQGHRHRLKTLRIVRASASIVLAEKLMNSPEVQAWKERQQ